jgi:hypothetical protein
VQCRCVGRFCPVGCYRQGDGHWVLVESGRLDCHHDATPRGARYGERGLSEPRRGPTARDRDGRDDPQGGERGHRGAVQRRRAPACGALPRPARVHGHLDHAWYVVEGTVVLTWVAACWLRRLAASPSSPRGRARLCRPKRRRGAVRGAGRPRRFRAVLRAPGRGVSCWQPARPRHVAAVQAEHGTHRRAPGRRRPGRSGSAGGAGHDHHGLLRRMPDPVTRPNFPIQSHSRRAWGCWARLRR